MVFEPLALVYSHDGRGVCADQVIESSRPGLLALNALPQLPNNALNRVVQERALTILLIGLAEPCLAQASEDIRDRLAAPDWGWP